MDTKRQAGRAIGGGAEDVCPVCSKLVSEPDVVCPHYEPNAYERSHVTRDSVVDFVIWLRNNDFGRDQGYPQGIRGLVEELGKLAAQVTNAKARIMKLEGLLDQDKVSMLNQLDEANLEITRLRRLCDRIRVLEAQVTGVNGEIKRWQQATGCATPEEWEGRQALRPTEGPGSHAFDLAEMRAQAALLEKVEAYARSLMGDSNDSCMSEDIGQGLLDLLGEAKRGV